MLGVALGAFSEAAYAADTEKAGRETGLPLPRFVSLKAQSVNLRVGPGRKYKIDPRVRPMAPHSRL
jgi:SH3-like domain-containing protein